MKFNGLNQFFKQNKSTVITLVITVLFLSLSVYVGLHPQVLLRWLQAGIDLTLPVWVSLALAFVVDIPVIFFETHWFAPDDHAKHHVFYQQHGRTLSVWLVIVLLLVGVSVGSFLVLPQLVESIATLTMDLPSYLRNTERWLMNWADKLPFGETLQAEFSRWFSMVEVDQWLTLLLNQTNDWVGTVLSMTAEITSKTIACLVGAVLSVYWLLDKQTLLLNGKKVLFAVLPRARCQQVMTLLDTANDCFHSFVSGQCLESLILGGLCLVGMWVLQLPYAWLISMVVAVSALVPFVGGVLSGVIGTLFLLLVNPQYAVTFLVFLVVLQQIEGNLIYPKVVGSSIGLPPYLVLLSVYVGGRSFGLLGVLIGVPTCSFGYRVLRVVLRRRLQHNQVVASDLEESTIQLMQD